MPTDSPIIEAEVITLSIPDAANLPPSLLSNIEEGFKGAFALAEKWRQEALAIHITDPSQTAKMKIARQKAEQELAARKAEEAARAEQAAAEQASKARAPDKEKMLDLAQQLLALRAPDFTSPEGLAFAAAFAEQQGKFAGWIKAQAAKL